MDILKIIFEHDMTMDHLSGHENPRNRNPDKDKTTTLEEFLRPQKTYCRYYFTGTRLDGKQTPENNGDDYRFGLNRLQAWPEFILRLDTVLTLLQNGTQQSSGNIGAESPPVRPEWLTAWHTPDGRIFDSLKSALPNCCSRIILISGNSSDRNATQRLSVDDHTGIRENFKPLTALLDHGHRVLISEKAHHGIDLHLFSNRNLHEPFFHEFRKMLSPDLRYFSINGKRVKSERHFYFETWTLDRPPHGFQEVTFDARMR